MDIGDYHSALSESDQDVCEVLKQEIDRGLPEAVSKLWHGHLVWFLKEKHYLPFEGYGGAGIVIVAAEL